MVRAPVACLLLAACSWSGAAVTPVKIAFVDTPTSWEIATDAGKSTATLVAGAYRLEIGTFDGACAPRSDLPFTEVDGQKSFAALGCAGPDGAAFDVSLVEIPSPDPEWPYLVAFGVVVTHMVEDGKIQMRSMGAVEIPMGVVPIAPVVDAAGAVQAPAAP